MTGEAWRRHLQTYVALRRAIGFSMRPEAHLLQDFVDHVERCGQDAQVAQVAVEWAAASAGQHAHRLSIVRGFLTMVRAAEPDVGVPGAGLLSSRKRSTPRILAPNEIAALMDAARELGPRDGLRPHTVCTVIGLLASCGLRAGEAIHLDIDHVDLVGALPCLQIQRTKFGKSRLVPLHPTTARRAANLRPATPGSRLWRPVQRLLRLRTRHPTQPRRPRQNLRAAGPTARAAWAGRHPRGQPSSPAPQLRRAPAGRVDAAGHRRPRPASRARRLPRSARATRHTYWYLTATSPVLEPASARFEAFVDGEVAP